MQSGRFGKAMQGPAGGPHQDRLEGAAALRTRAAPDQNLAFSALAIGAISLAIGTTGMGRITYDSAPPGYGRAIPRSELLMATSLLPPLRSFYAAPVPITVLQPSGAAPLLLAPPVALPTQPAARSLPSATGTPEPRLVAVAIHAGMPPAAGGAPRAPVAGVAAEMPRLHQCDPLDAVRAEAGIHCPQGAALAALERVEARIGRTSTGAAIGPSASTADTVAPGEAILIAQAAVEAAPRDAAIRYQLGAAYLEAGRFASAASAFRDAVALGNDEERTILALAISLAGAGRSDEAVALLSEGENHLERADLGVTLALIGEASRGSQLLEDAIIGGASDAGTRQDLALAYTLAGRWREARSLAEIDLGPARAHQMIATWLETSQPEALPRRIARYLQIGLPAADPGLPEQLALDTAPEHLPQVMLAAASRTDPIAQLASATAEADAVLEVASSPVTVARSDEVVDVPAGDAQDSIAVIFGDVVAGQVPLHRVAASTDALRLGDLLALFEGRMDGDLHAALSASPHARELVTFDRLKANGIAITRAAGGERLSLSLAEI